ncbi:MAG TPA: hypothetical protein VHN80_05685, partial [Kineosporiaceae bacterium]|nr:hypothetical protein [Kineosporiaceae bacterium]
LVRQLPAGRARDRQELNVLGAMSAPLNALLGYSSTELQWTLERSVALAELLGEHQVQLADLVGLFCVRFVQGHTAQAHEIAARALGLARAEADPDLTGQAHFAYAGTATSLGLPRTAVTHFDLACDLSTGTASLILGTRLEVHARAWAAHAHWLLGDEPRAVAMGADAVQLGRSSDHPYSLAVGLAYAAITDQLRGDIPSMLTAVAELRALCRRYDFAYYAEWAPILEGWATGGDAGITLIREGIARLRSQGSFARMPYWLSLLAETLIDAGRLDAARGVLDGAVGAAYQRDDRWWLPEVLRRRAALEPGPEGVERLRRAVDIAAEQHSLTLEARCRADLRARTAPEAVSCDDGVPGVDGVDGVPGFDGVPDVPGVDGRDEVDGVDGRSSVRIVRSPRP